VFVLGSPEMMIIQAHYVCLCTDSSYHGLPLRLLPWPEVGFTPRMSCSMPYAPHSLHATRPLHVATSSAIWHL
jgi:hypothetical protein